MFPERLRWPTCVLPNSRKQNKNAYWTPHRFSRNAVFFVVLEKPFVSRNKKECGLGIVVGSPFVPATEISWICRTICSRNRKILVSELSSDGRLTSEGPGGESPNTRFSNIHEPCARYLVPATFPKPSHNSTWWGSSQGTTWCLLPRASKCHRMAYGCFSLREKLGFAKEIERGRSTQCKPWKFPEQWKPSDPVLPQPSRNFPAAQFGFCQVLVYNRL